MQSSIREDWESLTGDELEAEIKSVEKLYLQTGGERKEIEKAINGLASISEKMAVYESKMKETQFLTPEEADAVAAGAVGRG